MAKFHVVLDTNVFRKSPSLNSLPFEALRKLCKAGVVKLHIPWIIEEEFRSQQIEIASQALNNSKGALLGLLKQGMATDTEGMVKAVIESIDKISPNVLENATKVFDAWIAEAGAQTYSITKQQAEAAWKSYFAGTSPFKVAKVRGDIPDAFIYQASVEILNAEDALVFICEDQKLGAALAENEKVAVHKSLADFVSTGPIQNEILDLDVVQNLAAIVTTLVSAEEGSGKVAKYVVNEAGEKLIGKTFHSPSIPDDNHEAHILSYYDPEDVLIDFDSLNYFGSGEFGVPFGFSILVRIYYYVFKADFYLAEDRPNASLSDHNDHYFEAEEEVQIQVGGLLRLSVPVASLPNISADTLADTLEIAIDSVDDIELLE